MAVNTHPIIAETLREVPNTNLYGHLNMLSYWNGLLLTLLTGCEYVTLQFQHLSTP